MNAREKFLSVMRFEPNNETLVWEFGYWPETLRRWYEEGLPCKTGLPGLNGVDWVSGEAQPWPLSEKDVRDVDVHDYFEVDEGMQRISINEWIFPPFKEKTVEENNIYKIVIDEWGIKKKIQKNVTSMPQFLDWPVKNQEDFELIKERLNPRDKRRFPKDWIRLVKKHKKRNFPLGIGGYPVGFFGSLRFLIGTNLYYMYYDNPELIKMIVGFLTEFWINLWIQVLDKIEVDFVIFFEDIAYKGSPLISPDLFRKYMMPYYKKITEFLRGESVDIILVDTDGDFSKLIPLFLESGITGFYPFEVQAGMDVLKVRKNFPELQIIGGLDKTKIALGKVEIDKELDAKIPFMLEKGGYIPCADHDLPPNISWENFVYYRGKLNRMIEKFKMRGSR